MIAVMLGHALVATNDPKNFVEAKQILKVAVNRDNEDPFAWYQLGIIYDREGDQARAALATAERNNLEGNPKLALASAQMAMKGIPPGTPDYLRAQDIAMVSRAELAKKDKKYRKYGRVSEAIAPRGEAVGCAAIGGGVDRIAADRRRCCCSPFPTCSAAGSSARACSPTLKILSDAVDALRDAQYAPVLAATARARNAVRERWKGAAKPEVTLVEFFDYACPYCKASNPCRRPAAAREDKDLRLVYRELPILGPTASTAARLSLEASKLGRFARFHDTLWAAGRPGARDQRPPHRLPAFPPQPKPDPLIEAELKRNFQLAGALGATGTPLFVIGDRVERCGRL